MTTSGRPHDFLVAGIPGAGKSDLRKYVADEHGYFEISFNGEDPPQAGDSLRAGLRQRFERGFQDQDARKLVQELRRISGGVVAEWGFPINEPCLALARSIRENGLPVVWLECPDDVARKRFVARNTVQVSAFDAQVSMIRAHYKTIMETVDPIVIHVVKDNGHELTTAETYEAVVRTLAGG